MTAFDVVIVGAGHAGAHAAMALRQQGYTGSVAIVGGEQHLPYERPPLSKDYLAGKCDFERLILRPAEFWDKCLVRLLLGSPVTAIDPLAHKVALENGTELGYGHLIWATGGAPRQLTCAGYDLRGVHAIRTRDDVDRLVKQLPLISRVVIIGGGYIGLEAAAILRKLDKQVVLLEALPRVLARVAGEKLSRFYENEHRSRGVDVRLDQQISRIEGVDGSVAGVRLINGALLPAEAVIVGIGIVPTVKPLEEAGADCPNGVRVDKYCQTSLPDIYAIGDCALHSNAFAGDAFIRLESVQNANDQAAVVAATILKTPKPYDAVPWFWSHQYDLRLQTVGLSTGHDTVIQRGALATRSFSLIYLRDGCVIALDSVNAVRDYMQGRVLVQTHAAVDPILLADVTQPLKSLTATV